MRFADQWLSKSVEKGKLKEEEKGKAMLYQSLSVPNTMLPTFLDPRV